MKGNCRCECGHLPSRSACHVPLLVSPLLRAFVPVFQGSGKPPSFVTASAQMNHNPALGCRAEAALALGVRGGGWRVEGGVGGEAIPSVPTVPSGVVLTHPPAHLRSTLE